MTRNFEVSVAVTKALGGLGLAGFAFYNLLPPFKTFWPIAAQIGHLSACFAGVMIGTHLMMQSDKKLRSLSEAFKAVTTKLDYYMGIAGWTLVIAGGTIGLLFSIQAHSIPQAFYPG